MGKFNYNEAPENDPIRIEQVFAEKPGGGVVHVTEDMPATTPVSIGKDGVFEKTASTLAFFSIGTSGSNTFIVGTNVQNVFGVKAGDFVYYNNDTMGTAHRVISVDDNYIKLGGGRINETSAPNGTEFHIAVGSGLDVDEYVPAIPVEVATPAYITGHDLKADDGEYQSVRLINGANVRKETAVITEEQAAKMSGIHLV